MPGLKRVTFGLAIALITLSALVVSQPARAASSIPITFNPSPLSVKTGDTGKHLISLSLNQAPPSTINLQITADSKLISLGVSQLAVTPTAYQNLPFGVTLTAAGANSTNLGGTGEAISVSGTASDGLTTAEGTLQVVNADTLGAKAGAGVGAAVGTAIPAATAPAGFGSSLTQLLGDKTGFVYISWQWTRGIIDVLLIVALLLISFTNILRINIDTYTIKKALPNLVIGVILANASFLIVRYMADISNVAVYLFVNAAGNLPHIIPKVTDFNSFIAAVGAEIGINALTTASGVVLTGTGVVGAAVAVPILVLLFALFTIIILLWLGFLLYFRLVMIYLLTIIAPIAFVAYGVPGFDKYFKQWWQLFIKWLFILVAMSALFWLILVISNASSDNHSWASLLITYSLLVTALTLPSKMGGAIIDKASKAFQQYTGANAAKKYGQDTFNAGKERAGLRFQQGFGRTGLGKKLADIRAKRTIDTENIKKDIGQLGDEANQRVRAGKAGRNTADLAANEEIIKNRDARLTAENDRLAFEKRASEIHKTEYEKREAEATRDRIKNEEKLEYIETNTEGQALLKRVVSANAQMEEATDAIKKSEGIATGNFALEELKLLRDIEQHSNLTKKIDEERKGANDPAKIAAWERQQRELEASYNSNPKDHPGLEYFRGHSIADAAAKLRDDTSPEGKLLKAKVSQAAKKVEASAKATIEADLEGQTIDEATKEMEDLFAEMRAEGVDITKFLKGDTVGVKTDFQRRFSNLKLKHKDWSAKRYDPRQNGSIANQAKMHFLAGGGDLKVIRTDTRTGNKSEETVNVASGGEVHLKRLLDSGEVSVEEKNRILRELAERNPNLFSAANATIEIQPK